MTWSEWIPASDILVTTDHEFCHGCKREFSWDACDAEDWNEARVGGVVAWLTCPACQTPGDHAAATVNTVAEEIAWPPFTTERGT